MKKGFVYILKSSNCQRYYIGSTSNYVQRLSEHNVGKVRATRGKGPWIIILLQEYTNITLAKKTEAKIKRLKSRIIIERMIKDRRITL